MRLMNSLIAAFSLMMASANAFSQDVLWLKSLSGNGAQQNKSIHIAESTIALLRDYLPEMKFTEVVVNNKRAYNLLASEPHACAGNKLKTDSRVQQYYFTDLPQTLSVGLRLFVIKASQLDQYLARQYPEHQPVSVEQVLHQDSLKVLGVVGGRAYGNQLDKVLAEPSIQAKLWSRTSSDMFVGLLKMLLKNRLQAIVEYPSVVNRYDKRLFQNTELSSYPITEASEMGLGYIMCSKTEQGRELVKQFNRGIRMAYHRPEYFQLHLGWNGQISEAELRRMYNKVYPQVTEPID